MHRLSASFVLAYHGCHRATAEQILRGADFKQSDNAFDWLGPGIYFWESNPLRGLQFAHEQALRKGRNAQESFVLGAIVDLGFCLDLTTSLGIDSLRSAYRSLARYHQDTGLNMPSNTVDLRRRDLDCAVIRRLHTLIAHEGGEPVQTVKGIFTEGGPVYPNAGICEKTHVQIAVRDRRCIKGVFRVPEHDLQPA